MEFIARRRNFLINKDLQFSLLCITLGYVIFFFLVMAASLFIPLMVNLKADGGTVSKTALASAQNLIFLHNNFWLPSFLCLISISIHSIRTSHRIAGPIYRLNSVIDAIKQGIIPKHQHSLRKGDYLTTEFSNVSAMLDNLRTRLGDIQSAHESLDTVIEQCKKHSDGASRDELMKSLRQITEKCGQLGDTINYFSIQGNDSSCGSPGKKEHPCSGQCACDNKEEHTSESTCS